MLVQPRYGRNVTTIGIHLLARRKDAEALRDEVMDMTGATAVVVQVRGETYRQAAGRYEAQATEAAYTQLVEAERTLARTIAEPDRWDQETRDQWERAVRLSRFAGHVIRTRVPKNDLAENLERDIRKLHAEIKALIEGRARREGTQAPAARQEGRGPSSGDTLSAGPTSSAGATTPGRSSTTRPNGPRPNGPRRDTAGTRSATPGSGPPLRNAFEQMMASYASLQDARPDRIQAVVSGVPGGDVVEGRWSSAPILPPRGVGCTCDECRAAAAGTAALAAEEGRIAATRLDGLFVRNEPPYGVAARLEPPVTARRLTARQFAERGTVERDGAMHDAVDDRRIRDVNFDADGMVTITYD